jgi:outer membrane protein assembly factor BamE
MSQVAVERLNRSLRSTLLALVCVAASGCVYRMNIQQGNFLDGDAIAQLQAGMTRAQVRYLLGTPMVPGAFDNERWDYLYYLKTGRFETANERKLTVFFEKDKVARIEKVNTPGPGEHSVTVAQGGKNDNLWRRLIRRPEDAPASVALPSDRF